MNIRVFFHFKSEKWTSRLWEVDFSEVKLHDFHLGVQKVDFPFLGSRLSCLKNSNNHFLVVSRRSCPLVLYIYHMGRIGESREQEEHVYVF